MNVDAAGASHSGSKDGDKDSRVEHSDNGEWAEYCERLRCVKSSEGTWLRAYALKYSDRALKIIMANRKQLVLRCHLMTGLRKTPYSTLIS